MIGAEVVVVGEPFLAVMDHLVARSVAVCTVESLRAAEPVEPEDPDESNVAMRQLTRVRRAYPRRSRSVMRIWPPTPSQSRRVWLST